MAPPLRAGAMGDPAGLRRPAAVGGDGVPHGLRREGCRTALSPPLTDEQEAGPQQDTKEAIPMLHDTQQAIVPALHELLSTVSALRNDILAESEELYDSW